MLSTCYAESDQDKCGRWSKQKKRYELEKRPEVFRLYNKNIDGVHAFCLSFAQWTMKWIIRLILHLFDLTGVNLWL